MFEEEENGGGAGWIVSFADLMTLLFCAFVVLYALKKDGETDLIPEITAKIREAFVEIPDDVTTQEQGPTPKGIFALRYLKGETAQQPIILKFRRDEMKMPIINRDKQKMKSIVQDTFGTVVEDGTPQKKDTEVLDDDDGFTIRIVGSVLYEPGKYIPNEEAERKLRKIGFGLKELGQEIIIEGHTDSSPMEGKLSNIELSAMRAGYIVRSFIQEVGIEPKKIRSAGAADTKPVASNFTPEGRALNRRIEIKVRYEE